MNKSGPRAFALGCVVLFVATTVRAQPAYTITDAKFAPVQHEYLSISQIEPHLKPDDLKLLPELSGSKVIVLAITFKGDGKSDLNSVDLDDLQVQWSEKANVGNAPAVGAHFSKDFILIRQKGIFVSMKNSSHEFFFIVPTAVSRVSLASRQLDAGFAVVKPNISLKPGPRTRTTRQ